MNRPTNLKVIEGGLSAAVPAPNSGSSPAGRGRAWPGLDPGGAAQMPKPSGLTGGVVEGAATEFRVANADLGFAVAERAVPQATRQAGMFGHVVAASLFAHAALIAAGFNANLFGEARTDGGAEEAIVIEGVSVEMLDSLPQPLPTAREITEADVAAPITEATAKPVADEPAIEPDHISTAELAADPIATPSPTDSATPDNARDPAAAFVETHPPLPPLIPAEAGIQAADTSAASADERTSQTDASAAEAQEVISLAAAPEAPIVPEVAEEALTSDQAETPAATARAAEALPATVSAVDETASVEANPSTEAEPATETAADEAPRPVEVVALAEVPVPRPPARARSIRPDADLEKPKVPAAAKAEPKPAKAAALGPASDTAPSPASVAEPLAKGPTKGKAGAGGSDSSQKGKGATASYQAKLVAHLRRFRNYPDEARRRKITGTAVVSFTIDAGGRVVSARLAGTTGKSILDHEALAMVRRASPFPAIPPDTGQSRFTVRAPIRFDMK